MQGKEMNDDIPGVFSKKILTNLSKLPVCVRVAFDSDGQVSLGITKLARNSCIIQQLVD